MPINRQMGKEDVVHIYTKEYYSAIKRNEIGSSAETWIDLESVIQSQVSQKEKNKYRMLTHIRICGFQKNGTDEPVCKAEIDTDVENKHMDTKRGKQGHGWWWWWWDELGDWD